MNKDISVCISCGPFTEELLPFLFKNIEKTSHNFGRFIFLLGTSPYVSDTKLKKNLEKYLNSIKFINCKSFDGHKKKCKSFSHASVINELVKHCDTKYSILMDPDIAFTYKNWDEIVIEFLTNYKLFGVPYKSFNEDDKLVKYQSIPNAIFCIGESKLIRSIDWSPHHGLENYIKTLVSNSNKPFYLETPLKFGIQFISNDKLSTQYNCPIGSYVYLDTGYMATERLSKESVKCLNFVNKNRLFSFDFMIEEYYLGDKLFLTHAKKIRNNSERYRNWKKVVLNFQ